MRHASNSPSSLNTGISHSSHGGEARLRARSTVRSRSARSVRRGTAGVVTDGVDFTQAFALMEEAAFRSRQDGGADWPFLRRALERPMGAVAAAGQKVAERPGDPSVGNTLLHVIAHRNAPDDVAQRVLELGWGSTFALEGSHSRT